MAGAPPDPRPQPPFKFVAPVMGTVMSIHVFDRVDPAVAEGACADVLTTMQHLESIYSTFDPHSEVSRINRGELDVAQADPTITDVLDACTWLDHRSGGAFRAFRPDTGLLDPAGFVKGWAAERSAAALVTNQLEAWSINVGGDVLVRGRPAPDVPWRIAVVDPHDDRCTIATVITDSGAVATSGRSQRGEHLWDGRSRQPADFAASVTVVGPSLTWADALATTVYALGRDGMEWIEDFDDYEAMMVTQQRDVLTTRGFARRSAAN